MKITKEQYENHDCKLSQDDGCEVCEQWAVQKYMEKKKIDLMIDEPIEDEKVEEDRFNEDYQENSLRFEY